jgi:hypothetical protein
MSQDKLIQFIYDDMREAKKDIKSLLEFKNKALGILVVLTALFSGAFSFLMALIR